MGQHDIADFLNNNKGKRYGSKEICKELNIMHRSMCVGLRKAFKNGLIKREYVKNKGEGYGYFEYKYWVD